MRPLASALTACLLLLLAANTATALYSQGAGLLGNPDDNRQRVPGTGDCLSVQVNTDTSTSQANGNLGGATDPGRQPADATVELEVVLLCTPEPPLDPQTPATVSYQGAGSGVIVDALVPGGGADPDCVEWSPSEYNVDLDISYSGGCIKWQECGGERLDDIVSGEIAGDASTGRYREYLDQIVGLLSGVTETLSLGSVPAGSVNDVLLSQGLGDRPSDDLLPVFYWCAARDENFVFDPIDIASVSFGWDLTYDDVYDIPATRDGLYADLAVALDLYEPDIGLVPPAEKGFTYAQYPTWMYLENPPGDIAVTTPNSTDTLRIDLRATLIGVQWHFGDTLIKTCSADELVKYEPDLLDPIEDLSECHHIFKHLDCQDLMATTQFKIEQRITSRLSAVTEQYPNTGWTDYQGTSTVIELASTIDNYEVHEILSLNVPQGMSRDQIIANARANGQLPDPDESCSYLAARN